MNLYRAHYRLLFVTAVLLAAAVSGARGVAKAAPVTLESAYRSALITSETIGISAARRSQAEENYRQARGGILPRISATATYLQQAVPGSGEGGVSGAFRQDSQTTARITLNQPLFRGLSEYAGLRAADRLYEAADLDLSESKLSLYESVATSYYRVLAAEQDRAHLQELLRLTGERVKELRAREKIGRSRRAEVLAAQSQEQAVAAAIRTADSAVAREREEFARLTGLAPGVELAPAAGVASAEEAASRVKPLHFYLSRVERRYDVKGGYKRFEAADEAVAVAKGAHFPTLDLDANYYLKRPGILEDTRWDFQLTLRLPIYAGGVIQSNVRESAAARRAAELQYESARRQATTEIRTFHRQAELLASELAARTEAVRAAERSYETHKRDYALGLATNLEVLAALNSTVEARRDRDRTFYSYWSTLAALEAAAVTVPAVEAATRPSDG